MHKNRHFVSYSVELPNNNHSKGLSKINSHAGTKILISSQGFLCFKGREKKCITELLISSAQACLHGSAHNKTCELGLDRQSKLTILKFTLQDVYVLNKKYIIVPEHDPSLLDFGLFLSFGKVIFVVLISSILFLVTHRIQRVPAKGF